MADFATPSHTMPVVSGHPAGKAPSPCSNCRGLEVQAPVLGEDLPAELPLCLMGLPGNGAALGPVLWWSVALDCCVTKV